MGRSCSGSRRARSRNRRRRSGSRDQRDERRRRSGSRSRHRHRGGGDGGGELHIRKVQGDQPERLPPPRPPRPGAWFGIEAAEEPLGGDVATLATVPPEDRSKGMGNRGEQRRAKMFGQGSVMGEEEDGTDEIVLRGRSEDDWAGVRKKVLRFST